MSPASGMGPRAAGFRQWHGTTFPPVMGPPERQLLSATLVEHGVVR
jgi:hypothetical protein